MQRFGSFSVRTHELGKQILACNWKEVARLILIQHADYDPDDAKRKEKMCSLVFPEKDENDTKEDVQARIGKAIEMLDRRDRLEKTVLLALKNSPNDYYSCFASISRNTRFIYIHAY